MINKDMQTFSKELIEWLESKELVTTVDQSYILLREPAPLKKLTDVFALNSVLSEKTTKVPCLFVFGIRLYSIYYHKNVIVVLYKSQRIDAFKIKKKNKEAIVELTNELKQFINNVEYKITEKEIEYISEEIKRLQKNKRALVKTLNVKGV